jgi:hypothetical protein
MVTIPNKGDIVIYIKYSLKTIEKKYTLGVLAFLFSLFSVLFPFNFAWG